ncbi:hypothetical protein QVH35_03775 [Candidatus Nitrosotenuis chungbukensis]|uniref:hypothetical protein n=1 Tax=Candidatus Nitrosotenuis chungbukensis TaxID=1353246 RepID=UPI0012FF56D1|nr:hypothetical protein [Candidatus Nitrosotenuis chungbukensis]WKT58513.1 hypothetical protein QVH35_03775 [Candidatus Nitrosotenuis chungbukensis]
MEKITTVTLSTNTKNLLDKFGQKNETYDQLISKILLHVEKCEKFAEVKTI